jgi:hypothetical protein
MCYQRANKKEDVANLHIRYCVLMFSESTIFIVRHHTTHTIRLTVDREYFFHYATIMEMYKNL